MIYDYKEAEVRDKVEEQNWKEGLEVKLMSDKKVLVRRAGLCGDT